MTRLTVGLCVLVIAASSVSRAEVPSPAGSARWGGGEGLGPPLLELRQVPVMPKDGKVAVVKLGGTVDLGLAPFLSRVIDDLGPKDILVLDINTFGGRIDAAVVIRDALLHSEAKTVCWVNPRAISAGALISLACDVIAVAPGATIGAATPVTISGGEMKPVEEKVVSYMRKEMRSTAEAKGRSGEIAEAMVDSDVEVPGLNEKGKLLTLDGDQALKWRIAEVQAADEHELWRALDLPDPPPRLTRPKISWAERLARFLSDPTIAGLLMTLGMLGILIELYSPGHGVALTVGLVCLALFFFGHHVVKLAGWEEIILFLVGVGLLVFEVMVPGHIVPGIIGVILIVASLVMALVNLESVPLDVAWEAGWLTRAIAHVFGSILATALLAWGATKVLPKTRVGKALVLDTAIRGPGLADDGLSALVGGEGTASTDLRPSGKIAVDGRRVEALAETGYVAAGARVKVVRVQAGAAVVRLVDKEKVAT